MSLRRKSADRLRAASSLDLAESSRDLAALSVRASPLLAGRCGATATGVRGTRRADTPGVTPAGAGVQASEAHRGASTAASTVVGVAGAVAAVGANLMQVRGLLSCLPGTEQACLIASTVSLHYTFKTKHGRPER